jgi:myo-inositol 2-dehydrogenase/D-chiro-inositol 1-dehydrogenase
MIRADNIRETSVEFAGAQGFATDKVLNFFLERYASAYRDELDAFVKGVNAGVAPRPNGQDGLRANLLADAANLSWRTKQRVAVG